MGSELFRKIGYNLLEPLLRQLLKLVISMVVNFWLVPDDRKDVPKDAYATAGNRGQYVIIVPSYNLVIVRRGLDYGRQGFNRWDLTREVLKAF